MDRATFDADTDNIVVVDPTERRLTWVPRDLWCELLEDRINRAFARGGHELLIESLAEHGIAVRNSLCLGRKAVESGLEGAAVMMPIRRRLEFWYPLKPDEDIAAGRKRVVFEPPVERLSGERFHQWLGARYGAAGLPDLDRIGRQQELLAVMLGDGFDFRRFLESPAAVRISAPAALRELSLVKPGWRSEIVGGLAPAVRDGKRVLVR